MTSRSSLAFIDGQPVHPPLRARQAGVCGFRISMEPPYICALHLEAACRTLATTRSASSLRSDLAGLAMNSTIAASIWRHFWRTPCLFLASA